MSKQALEAEDRAAPYEEDFYLWLLGQAELLRQGRVQDLDLENLAEEVESIGRSDKREVCNRLVTLMAHLLKYDYQSEKRTRSWRATIREQRRQLELLFQDSPSLKKTFAPTILSDGFHEAKLEADDETGLGFDTFPETCPHGLEQLLDDDFFPEAPNG